MAGRALSRALGSSDVPTVSAGPRTAGWSDAESESGLYFADEVCRLPLRPAQPTAIPHDASGIQRLPESPAARQCLGTMTRQMRSIAAIDQIYRGNCPCPGGRGGPESSGLVCYLSSPAICRKRQRRLMVPERPSRSRGGAELPRKPVPDLVLPSLIA